MVDVVNTKRRSSFFRICNNPEIGKRLQRLGYHFSSVFYFFTTIFVQAGLIEKNHPYALRGNIGRYSFGEVVALAFSNIQWKKKNIPQIMMFFAVILAVILVFLCIGMTIFQLIFQTGMAYAQTPPAIDANAHMFSNPATDASRQTDWVYMLLSNIFGDTGLGYFAGSSGFQATWIHQMLTSMLSLYSIAMMVVAAIIIAYYITTAVLETSAEGVPFGERFNLVWAPIRFVLALALLAPVSNGYNVAQLIVFQAADWGSGFASHIWATGLQAFGDQEVIGTPPPDKGATFVRGLWFSSLCMSAYNQYLIDQSKTVSSEMMRVTTSADTEKGDDGQKTRSVIFRFGNKLAPDYCGAFRIPIVEQQVVVYGGLLKNQGARIIEATYQDIFYKLSGGLGEAVRGTSTYGWGDAGNLAQMNGNIGNGVGALNDELTPSILENIFTNRSYSRPIPAGGADLVSAINGQTLPSTTSIPSASYVFTQFFNPESPLYNSYDDVYSYPYFNVTPSLQTKWLNDIYQGTLNTGLENAKAAQEEVAKQMVIQGASHGWGQAGAYFMILAQMNDDIHSAFSKQPSIVKLPELLTNPDSRPEAKGFRATKFFRFITAPIRFWKYIFGKEVPKDDAAKFAYDVMLQGKQWWDNTAYVTGDENAVNSSGAGFLDNVDSDQDRKSGFGFGAKNMFQKIMSWINQGLLVVVQNIVTMVDTYNPFASLANLGNILGLIGMRLLAVGITLTIVGIGLGMVFIGMASALLSVSFALGTFLPIMPYFYFTMAVITWAVGIFEAIVAMPLWALSFLKIDGEGVLPDDSMNAVWIIFQIFLRPPMIIISLVGSMLVFSGTIIFLNLTFGQMMMSMLAASSIASPVMAIFMLFGYAYIVYSLATAIFKMVDTVPDMIIDYLGIGRLTPMTDYDDPKRVAQGAFIPLVASLKSGISNVKEGNDINEARKAEEAARRAEQERKRNQQNIFNTVYGHTGSATTAQRVIDSLNDKNTPNDPHGGMDGDGI